MILHSCTKANVRTPKSRYFFINIGPNSIHSDQFHNPAKFYLFGVSVQSRPWTEGRVPGAEKTIYGYIEEGSVYAVKVAGKRFRICKGCLIRPYAGE